MSETLGLKNVNMLSKEQYDGVADPSNEELWAVSGLGVGFPSDKYIDLTLGASGSTYTAPASGWLALRKQQGDSTYKYNLIDVNGFEYKDVVGGNTAATSAIVVPMKKGDVATIKYATTGKVEQFRFIYAVGEE